MSLEDDKKTDIETKVKKMIADEAKGWATSKELITGIKTAIASELEKDETLPINKKFAESQKQIKDLETELVKTKNQIKNMLSGSGDMGTPYKGFKSLDQCKNFGLFVLSVCGNKSASDSLKAIGVELKGMGDSNSSGSFLVPQEFITALITMTESYGVFRQNTSIYPMESDTAQAPMLTKGLTVYCPGAGKSATASNLTFGMTTLKALKWITYTLINKELTEDSAIAVGALVADMIAEAFAAQEDECAFNGDGTADYFNVIGFIQSIYKVNTTVASNAGLKVQDTAGPWSSIDLQDLLALDGILPSFADKGERAKYYCNKRFYYTVMLNAALAAGGTSATEILTSILSATPTFLGRNVAFTQVMYGVKPEADHCPLLLGNLKRASYLGERRMRTIEQSTEAAFVSDQIAIKGTQRIAIDIYGHKATDKDNNTAAGTIVGFWADIE